MARIWLMLTLSSSYHSFLQPSCGTKPVESQGYPVLIIGGRHPIGSSLDSRRSMAHRNADGSRLQHRNVIVPITYRHHRCRGDTKLLTQGQECCGFIHALMRNLQIGWMRELTKTVQRKFVLLLLQGGQLFCCTSDTEYLMGSFSKMSEIRSYYGYNAGNRTLTAYGRIPAWNVPGVPSKPPHADSQSKHTLQDGMC